MEMEMENPFKKISVLPNEKDFADAIVSRIQHQALIKTVLPKSYSSNCLRRIYRGTVWSVALSYFHKLIKVSKEFRQTHPSHDQLMKRHYKHYNVALRQVIHASQAITSTANGFMRLMDNKDCDSLYKFKCLLLSSLGCLYALAEKAVPTLAYLDHVRHYMASRTESNLEDYDDFAASTLAETKYKQYLAQEGCKFPLTVDVPNVANPADPNVMIWLEEFKREHGLRLEDDQPHSAELSRNPMQVVLARCTKALLT